MTKVCYVLAYRAPHYIRTENLLGALEAAPDVELYVARNRRTGILRYLETAWRFIKILIRHKPDWIVIGFRGLEIYPLIRLFVPRRKIIIDSMMSPTAALVQERGGLARFIGYRLTRPIERWILSDCAHILTDTDAHRRFLADFFALPEGKITAIPVCADESVIPARDEKNLEKTVLFYGSFLPLHGFEVILEAMTKVKCRTLSYCFVGLSGPKKLAMDEFIARHPEYHIKLVGFLPFDVLIEDYVARAWLMLGGPFGGTPQALRVITGKTAQALYLGIPTVIGRNEETGLMRDKLDGLLVEQGNASDLAAAIDWACDNEEKLAAIGANGKVYYTRHLSAVVVQQRLRHLFDNLPH